MDGGNQAENIQLKSPQQITNKTTWFYVETRELDQSDIKLLFHGCNPDRGESVCVNDIPVF